jgi:hypothetical protein
MHCHIFVAQSFFMDLYELYIFQICNIYLEQDCLFIIPLELEGLQIILQFVIIGMP